MILDFITKRDAEYKIDLTKPVLTFLGESVQIGASPDDIFRLKDGILHCCKFASQMKVNSEKTAQLALKIGKANKFVLLTFAEYSLLRKIVSYYDQAKNPRTGRYENIISIEMGEQIKRMVNSYNH